PALHMKLCDLQFTRQAGAIVFPKRFLPKERWNDAALAEARAEIERHLAILEKHLAGKNYLVAEQFSLADLCYAPFLEFLPLMEITPPPTVAAWSEMERTPTRSTEHGCHEAGEVARSKGPFWPGSAPVAICRQTTAP